MSTLQTGYNDINYTLEEPKGVYAILTNLNYIESAAYTKGDNDCLLILLDLQTALKNVTLSRRQNDVMYYVVRNGFTQQEAADKMGIKRQTVHQIIWIIVDKIVNQFGRKQGAR